MVLIRCFTPEIQTMAEYYFDRWIDCAGSVVWPARFSDLTPLDFFGVLLNKKKLRLMTLFFY